MAQSSDERRGPGLHWRILAGLAVGAIAGVLVNEWAPRGQGGGPSETVVQFIKTWIWPIGRIFINLILMVVIPLMFAALVLGITGMGEIGRLGRVGLRTLIYTVILSTISVLIGVGSANLFRPGDRLDHGKRAELRERYAAGAAEKIKQAHEAKPLRQVILDLVPTNPFQDAVFALDSKLYAADRAVEHRGGGMLAFMFFALIFGIAAATAPERTRGMLAVLEGVYDVTLAIIGFAMRLAPIWVAALIFTLAAELGLDILRTLAWYVVTVIGGLLLHMAGVYSLVVAALARLRPLWFFKQSSEAMVTAFATASSNATLPTSLRVAERDLGLKREVSGFVLTVGSTANQNGTALYEGVTVLFLAQVFGVDLSVGAQFTVALLCILAGVGTAGVPGGSLPLVVMVMQTVNIPAEGIGIILGVDRLLDMCRTTVNVAGDLAIAACVNRAEPQSAAAL